MALSPFAISFCIWDEQQYSQFRTFFAIIQMSFFIFPTIFIKYFHPKIASYSNDAIITNSTIISILKTCPTRFFSLFSRWCSLFHSSNHTTKHLAIMKTKISTQNESLQTKLNEQNWQRTNFVGSSIPKHKHEDFSCSIIEWNVWYELISGMPLRTSCFCALKCWNR